MKSIIIDDEALARGIIREYLEAYPSIAIAEECENGFEGLKAIQHLAPRTSHPAPRTSHLTPRT